MNDEFDLDLTENVQNDVTEQTENIEESLPAVSEGVPEEIPEDTTYVGLEDYLSSNETDTTLYEEVQVDYLSNLEQLHEDLTSLNSTCSIIAFVLIIGYFVPFIRSTVHKFMFIGDKDND